MGKLIGGLCLVLFGGIVGYAVAKLEEDEDTVQAAYRRVKRAADEALDDIRENHPEKVAALRDAVAQVKEEFRAVRARLQDT